MKDVIEVIYGRKVHRYPFGAVPVPPMQWKIGTGTTQRGTGTSLQNQIGTGTEQCGTGTTGFCSPSLGYFCVFKLKFAYREYRKGRNYVKNVPFASPR